MKTQTALPAAVIAPAIGMETPWDYLVAWLAGFLLLVAGSAVPIALASGVLAAFAPNASADQAVLFPVADMYVTQAQPTTNFGNDIRWGVAATGEGFGGIAHLRFNVNLPAGATISAATLTVTCENASDEGGGSIYKFTPASGYDQWSETQFTWNNQLQGTTGPLLSSLPSVVDIGQSYTFSNLQSAITGNGYVTFIVKSDFLNGAKYYSKEDVAPSPAAADARRPRLTLTYTVSSTQAVETPTFSPSGAAFSTSQAVTMTTATSGAQIRYTINGTTPTQESTPYSGAITLSASATLKARAFKTGLQPSGVAVASFLQASAGGSATTITKTAAERSAASTGWTTSGTEMFCWTPPQWLEYSISFPSSGNWTFSLTGKNQTNSAAPGLPAGYSYAVDMTVDGVFKGTLQVPGSTTAWQTGQSAAISVSSGTHTVRFTWTNDAWQSGVYDANLRVQQVAFVGPPSGAAAFTLASPETALFTEAGGIVAIKQTGGSLTGSLEYLLFVDGTAQGAWSATPPGSWLPTVAQLGKHTLTLKVRNSPTGTPEQDSSDVFVIRTPAAHP